MSRSRITSFFHQTMSAHSPNPDIRNRDTKLAACALLLELANADDHFSERERDHLFRGLGPFPLYGKYALAFGRGCLPSRHIGDQRPRNEFIHADIVRP